MRAVKNINGNQLVDLCTKFYFIDDVLFYRLIIELRSSPNQRIVYGNFEDYTDYKQAFRKLQAARRNNEEIILPSLASTFISPPIRQRAN